VKVDPPLSKDRAQEPPPPGKSQETGVTNTSRTLLSPKSEVDEDSNMEAMYTKDDKYIPIWAGQGVRMTPLRLVVPIDIITPLVTRRNTFGTFNDDISSTKEPPVDTITPPLLQQVLTNIPLPDATNDMFAKRIVDNI
jgi:hypothetical protein